MTEVLFEMKDFSGVTWDSGTIPVLTFRASGPGLDAWGLYAGEVSVRADAGAVDLVPTVAMHGRVVYRVELTWFAGGIERTAFWGETFGVPETGPVHLFELASTSPSDLYQHVEVSEGTVDLDGNLRPHYDRTKIWLKLGADSGIYLEVE